MSARKRVAVVFGGRSSEHEVSCVSAGSVLRVIDRDRYDVLAIGITRQGRWMLLPDDPDAYEIRGHKLPAVPATGSVVTLPADPLSNRPMRLAGDVLRDQIGAIDVVFPLLHGPYGEDGTVQGLFEMAGVRYVGSGVLASALAMDKEFMKVVLAARGLPVPAYHLACAGKPLPDVRDIGFPCFVKPARGGSSLGITRVETAEQLAAAVSEAHAHDPKALVEQAVSGREIECGVLVRDGAPTASLPAEIRVHGHDFYDFAAKYYDDAGTQFDVPANLPEELIVKVQGLACAAFSALGCEGLARVDFFVRRDGSLLINEVNTMPGFTPASMFPRMWATSGLDYSALVDHLIEDALRRPTGLR